MQLNDTQPPDLRDVTLCAVDTINALQGERAQQYTDFCESA